MGAACFKQYPEAHIQAERFIKETRRQQEREVKLLLLGAGDSGKSTIAKQMKIIHKQTWSQEEKLEYKDIIIDNILSAMLSMIYGAVKYDYPLSAEAQEAAAPLTITFPQRSNRDVSLLQDIHIQKLKTLWNSTSIQSIYKTHGTRLQLPSSTSYFMDEMDTIFQKDYIPSEQDILRARRSTTGIHKIEFSINDIIFKCVDVGGQRTERRKWLHVFDDVTAVIFCVALDEYDLRMYEDETVWRVHESLQLFNEIANSTHLSGAAVILFMNKKDLFEQKIRDVDLTVTFPEYAGGSDFAKASECINTSLSHSHPSICLSSPTPPLPLPLPLSLSLSPSLPLSLSPSLPLSLPPSLSPSLPLSLSFPLFFSFPFHFLLPHIYLTVQFCSLMKQRERLYTHLTCATDTANISFVFSAIKDMLLTKMIGEAL